MAECRRCLNDCSKTRLGPGAPWWSPTAGSSARMEGMDKYPPASGDVPDFHPHAALELSAGPGDHQVTRQDLIVPAGQLCQRFLLYRRCGMVVGGATRTQSVLAGVGRPTLRPMSSASTTEPGPLSLRRCWSRSSAGRGVRGRRASRAVHGLPSSGPQAVWWRRR